MSKYSIVFEHIPSDCTSLLDVGCGRGWLGSLLKARTLSFLEPPYLAGVDGFKPYIEYCEMHSAYDDLIHRDLADVPYPFHDKEFDVVTAIDSLEHLTYDNGTRMLDELERLAIRRIVITSDNTGVRYEDRKDYDPKQDGALQDKNPYQHHLSHWTPKMLKAMGYRVIGYEGVRHLKPKYWNVIPPAFYKAFPQWCNLYIAVKNL